MADSAADTTTPETVTATLAPPAQAGDGADTGTGQEATTTTTNSSRSVLADVLDPESLAALEAFGPREPGGGDGGADGPGGTTATTTDNPDTGAAAEAAPDSDGRDGDEPARGEGDGDADAEPDAQQQEQEEDDGEGGEDDTGDGADPQSEDEDENGDEDEGEPEPAPLPAKVQKRIDRLVGQREEARERAEEAEARATDLESQVAALSSQPVPVQPTAENPLGDVRTPADLQGRLGKAQDALRWCLQHLDGAEDVPDGKGGTVDYSAADVARIKANAESAIYHHGPARQRYLDTHARAAEVAREEYPDLYRQGSEVERTASQILSEVPALLNVPDYPLLVGDMVSGLRDRLARGKAKAKPAPARDKKGKFSAAAAAAKAPATAKPEAPASPPPPAAAPAAVRPASRTVLESPEQADRRAAADRLFSAPSDDSVLASIEAKLARSA